MTCGVLIVLSGLPGVGKTTIARELARQIDAVHVRIDSIEQAIRMSGLGADSLDDVGYRVGYAVAEDNLRVGRTVVADSVNPVPTTRDAWLAVSHKAGADVLEVEIICSDPHEHQRRVERRVVDIEGLRQPTWQEVLERDYHRWARARTVIDTAVGSVADHVARVRSALALRLRPIAGADSR